MNNIQFSALLTIISIMQGHIILIKEIQSKLLSETYGFYYYIIIFILSEHSFDIIHLNI